MVGEPEPEPSAALDVPPGCFSIGQRLVAEWRDPRDWRRIQTLCHETYEGPDGAQFQLDTNWSREEAEILYMVATQARQGARDARSHMLPSSNGPQRTPLLRSSQKLSRCGQRAPRDGGFDRSLIPFNDLRLNAQTSFSQTLSLCGCVCLICFPEDEAICLWPNRMPFVLCACSDALYLNACMCNMLCSGARS